MWKCADDAVVRLIKETNLVVHQPTAAIFARLARESAKSADAAEWVPHACSISVLLGIAAVGSACGGTWTAPESISAFAEAEVTDEKSRLCFYLLGISLFDPDLSRCSTKSKTPKQFTRYCASSEVYWTRYSNPTLQHLHHCLKMNWLHFWWLPNTRQYLIAKRLPQVLSRRCVGFLNPMHW
ncbi:hypothetical protein DL89DRAFT_10208 [Linderina pennispora]|uniref:Uncharacterized protein n=1 Tax=Linderina pennispora TaxID=61395 RepID=A0A1Y1WKW1_9FUNG|nr:uncharacterized protein DL89DRAFT_10208 [Linderina pennispora]ORX74132.1 hypothetical protein DL89DRAFT_10208 [Linderina pennispora]